MTINYDFGDDYRSIPFEYEVDDDEYLYTLAKIIIDDCKMDKTETNTKGLEKLLKFVLSEDAVKDLSKYYENEISDNYLDEARETYSYGSNYDQDQSQFSQSDFI